jgi:hypothetical protein
MINVQRLFQIQRKCVTYCGECRFSLDGGVYCGCGKYDKDMEELRARDPEAYERCFTAD